MPISNDLLLLSYAFPPIAFPESYLAAKTVGNIPGYNVDVLCAHGPDHGFRLDPTFEKYALSRFRNIKHVPLPRWMSLIFGGPIPGRIFPWLTQTPDACVYLNRVALNMLRSTDLTRYAAIITWSQFHSVHLAGLSLKRKNPGIRWLAHFSDPWVDNPFVHYNPLLKFLNGRMERSVIESADKLIFTSQYAVDLVLSKYRRNFREKTHVIPHPFDSSLYQTNISPKNNSGTSVFRYIGNFYGIRTPAPLLKALDILATESPTLLEHVRFEFVGEVEKGLPGCVPSPQLNPIVKFLPPVDYLASLKLMKEADVLMVIDAPAAKSVFLPSKLVDYLGSGQPIIGITPPGTSTDLLKSLGHPVANPSSVEQISAMVREFILRIKSRGPDALPARGESVAEYSVETVGEKMAKLIDEVQVRI